MVNIISSHLFPHIRPAAKVNGLQESQWPWLMGYYIGWPVAKVNGLLGGQSKWVAERPVAMVDGFLNGQWPVPERRYFYIDMKLKR